VTQSCRGIIVTEKRKNYLLTIAIDMKSPDPSGCCWSYSRIPSSEKLLNSISRLNLWYAFNFFNWTYECPLNAADLCSENVYYNNRYALSSIMISLKRFAAYLWLPPGWNKWCHCAWRGNGTGNRPNPVARIPRRSGTDSGHRVTFPDRWIPTSSFRSGLGPRVWCPLRSRRTCCKWSSAVRKTTGAASTLTWLCPGVRWISAPPCRAIWDFRLRNRQNNLLTRKPSNFYEYIGIPYPYASGYSGYVLTFTRRVRLDDYVFLIATRVQF